ncbi:permease [Pararhodobacter sp. SW119]|uniref:permease n=1 Tax=Pararhodobacter sp. SW119 TaxID=2780075 RepID=UPI001AE0228A|nr:permease [Pararhodobacter sp. SW119]
MTDVTPIPAAPAWRCGAFWRKQRVWLAAAAILAAVTVFDLGQADASVRFILASLVKIAPFLLLSVVMAGWAGATGADELIARAFTGAPATMIALGALAGALSPFCSCGVIPLIAALLAMGVPLAPVMAFWLASPLMDPSMFVLTAGVLGVEFALAKTLAAIALGAAGGVVVHVMLGTGALTTPLRPGIGDGGCGGNRVRAPRPVLWRFWIEPARVQKFRNEALSITLFLAKWLTLAFLLESLMLAWIPAELVTTTLGGQGLSPIVTATLVGVPAYLNGYAALPLIGGLIGQGMTPGAGMAFLIAGGVTSIPAAIAVWALVRPPVFALYLALSLSGAFAAGLAFQFWVAL